MKIRLIATGFIVGVAAAAGAGAVSAALFQQPAAQPSAAQQPPAQPAPEEMKKMMKAWADSIAVGEQHKQLAKWAGKYDSTTRMWMMGPDQPPMEFKGTSEVKAVLGGRFIQQTDRTQMLLPDPATGEMKMGEQEGVGYFGYDNFQRMYVGTWVSNSSTQVLNMRGTMSPDGRKLTLYAPMDEPMLGVYGRLIKCETEYVDDDTQVFRVYDLAVGPDYKVFEIEYRRVK